MSGEGQGMLPPIMNLSSCSVIRVMTYHLLRSNSTSVSLNTVHYPHHFANDAKVDSAIHAGGRGASTVSYCKRHRQRRENSYL